MLTTQTKDWCMKKWIFSLSLIFSISSAHSKTCNKKTIDIDSVPTGYLSVKPEQVTGFSGEALDRVNKAFELLEAVVNSQEFKDRVLNFNNRNCERAFASNKGLTNEEIYGIFMEGREVLQPNTAGEMNFFIEKYYARWSRVIGYTNPSTNLIKVNWKYYQNFEPHQIASNLAHEWVHKIGFGHKSAKESDSAPYAIGGIVYELGQKYLKNSFLY